MTSVVSICNSALNILGANNIIALTEDSKNARLCNQRYIPIRNAVFREHHWNCLVKRIELARDTATPTHEFSYQYQLPADCIKVINIGGLHNGTSSNLDGGQIFKVEGRKIVTDEEQIFLVYSSIVEDVTEYDSLLVESISQRLAAELCYAITSSTSLANSLKAEYQEKLRLARHADATEGTADVIDSSTFINARF